LVSVKPVLIIISPRHSVAQAIFVLFINNQLSVFYK